MTQGRRPAAPSAWMRARELDAVHLGHVDVREDDVERSPAARASRAPRRASRSPRAPAPRAVWATRIRRFVALSSTISTRRPAGQPRRRGRRAAVTAPAPRPACGREVEGAAFAGDARALRRQRAAHQLGQAPADGQAQAGAAVAARDGGIDLAERLEQPIHAPSGMPMPVSRTRRDLPGAGPPRRVASSSVPPTVDQRPRPTR